MLDLLCEKQFGHGLSYEKLMGYQCVEEIVNCLVPVIGLTRYVRLEGSFG